MPPDLLLLEFWVFFDWTDVDNSSIILIFSACNSLKMVLNDARIGFCITDFPKTGAEVWFLSLRRLEWYGMVY